jgi:hypothetical protein
MQSLQVCAYVVVQQHFISSVITLCAASLAATMG